MRAILLLLLSIAALTGCAKKSEFNNTPDPGGVYINLFAKYLALGDSYTIGQSIPLDQSFPYQLARLLGQTPANNPTIIATRDGQQTI